MIENYGKTRKTSVEDQTADHRQQADPIDQADAECRDHSESLCSWCRAD